MTFLAALVRRSWGVHPTPGGCFVMLLLLLVLSSHALLLSFPGFSVLLFVKQVASLVKLELNLRQDSQ